MTPEAGWFPEMRVLMITGSYPPHVCGVGDYTARLCEALAGQGLEVCVLTSRSGLPAVRAFSVGSGLCPEADGAAGGKGGIAGGRGDEGRALSGPGTRQEESVRAGFPGGAAGITGKMEVALSPASEREEEGVQAASAPAEREEKGNTRAVAVRREVPSWGPLAALSAVERVIRDFQPDIIHIQYPTIGYGARLGPQFLAWRRISHRPLVVTLHEASRASFLRRVSLIPFGGTDRVITSTEEERSYLGRLPGFDRKRIEVIPVGSNIPALGAVVQEEPPVLTYFGLFYPDKGAELFIATARLARERLGERVRFRLVGQVHPKYAGYYRRLRAMEGSREAEWVIGAGDFEAARLIAGSLACWLPYRDGVSFRRSSFMAAAVNGCPVITTRGRRIPEGLKEGGNVLFAGSAREALQVIERLLEEPELRQRLKAGALALGRRFSWEAIAARHIEVYRGDGSRVTNF